MRFLLTMLSVLVATWLLGLAWFVLSIPRAPLSPEQRVDAIVVLTGGSQRVEHGLSLLSQGVAPVLFISGVGEGATEADLLDAHATQETREKIYERAAEIVLDHRARSTVSNADQSAAFIRERHIRSIRLVTANYHMNRSLAEFRLAHAEVTIYPDPVFPEGFRLREWLAHENTRHLVFSEFYKYLAVLLREVLSTEVQGQGHE